MSMGHIEDRIRRLLGLVFYKCDDVRVSFLNELKVSVFGESFS